MRKKRTITQSEKEYLLSIDPDNITLTLLNSLFSDIYDEKKSCIVPSRFNTYDEFSLKKGEYINTEDIDRTTCGILIFNKLLFEKGLYKVVGYWNKTISKKTYGALSSILDDALLKDIITVDDYIEYLNNLMWLSLGFNTQICSSLTIKSFKQLPSVTKRKNELYKKYKKELDSGDAIIAKNIETELLDIAHKELENDPAIDLYNSGARGGFNNSYKNAQVMKGAVFNPSSGKFEIMMNSQIDGIDKRDLACLANSAISSQYSKSIAPGDCGYTTKKISAAYQSVQLDEKGSDCKSKAYLEVVLDDVISSYYRYNYIIDNEKLVRLDDTTIPKYKGKKIKLRTTDTCICKNGKLCNICAGDMYYMLGLKYIGLTAPRLSNGALKGCMKKFHVSTVSYYKCTENDIL